MLLVRELVGGTRQRQTGRTDSARGRARGRLRRPAVGALVRALAGARRGRRLPGARRSGVEPRCSPSHTLGPQRLHEVPVPLEALPAVDAVIISHDHYDHLDIDTIIGLARTQRAPFVVPLGVGAHLRKWGIPERPHRRTRLARKPSHRRPDAGVHTRTALLRSVVLPQHHAVGVVGDRGTPSPRVLRRRHRLHQELRRDRRRPRAFRPDAAADRRVSPGVAGHPHEPRGCGPRSSRRRRGGIAACWYPFTGRRSGWPPTRGRSRSSVCSPPPILRACGWWCQGPGSLSIPPRHRRPTRGGGSKSVRGER